jgi:S1-C subfamily serine protease
MAARDQTVMRYLALSVVLAGVCGVLGGILSGWAMFSQSVQPELTRLQTSVDALSTSGTRPTTTPTQSPIEIIPVESRPLSPAYPSAFSDRRNSTVIALVRRIARPVADEPVSPDREFGAAVAVTSDGWLATSDAAIAGFRLSEIGAVVNGKVLAVERGVRDASTGITYLKVTASGLPTPAFVRASDVVPGAAIWVESHPRQLAPEILLTVRARPSADPVPSNKLSRRFLVSGAKEGRVAGASVWDGAGRLIGLLESSEVGGWRVIPAGPIGSTLSQIFSGDGLIRRSTLGVRALDLSTVTLDAATSSLPSLGVWLRADRRLKLPAVAPTGPSARVLLDGDVIERVERDILDGSADLGERLLDYRPGASVAISGRRKNAAFQAEVTLGSEVVSEQIK